MIDFSKLISLQYWFDTTPGELSPNFEYLFIAALVVCYVCFFASIYLAQRQRGLKNFLLVRFFKRVGNLWLTLAVLATFMFFFRFEGIPFFGGRFWMLAWAALGVVWGVKLIRQYKIDIPKLQKEREDYRSFAQYLPKKK